MNTRWITTCTLAASVLSGCAGNLAKHVDAGVNTNAVDATALLQQARHGDGAVAQEVKGPVDEVKGIWLPFKKSVEVNALNASDEAGKRRISVNREFRTIQELAERVSLLTGFAVNISPDAFEQQAGQQGANGAQVQQNPNVAIPALPQMSGSHAAGLVMPSLNPALGSINITYDGSLSGFFDVVCSRFGLSWEWGKGNSVNIFRYTTKTFSLVALPGDSTSNNTIAGTTTGVTSSSGVTISALSVWTAINDAIKGMLSAKGKVTVTPATGTVTVTDTPFIVGTVEKFIEAENLSLGMQVMVNIKVLSVDITDGDNYGINWSAFYNSLSQNFGMGLATNFTMAQNVGNLTLNVLGTAGSGVAGNSNIKAWQGTQAIISALSQQGKVSQVTSTSMMTLNNQPVPLQVGQQISYLASSSTTLTQGVGATTTLTPGSVTTGFSMSLVPHILEQGKLLLQFAINISSLVSLNTVTSQGANSSSIQTPNIDTSNFLQRVMITSGNTLVMTGFEQVNLSGQSQGVGSANNVALGGAVNRTAERNVLVILVQPVVGEY